MAGGDLGRHRRRRAVPGQGGGGAEEEHGGAVGQDDEGDGLPRLGPVEHVGQQHAGLGRAGVADGGGQVGGDRLGPHARSGGEALDGPAGQTGDGQVVDVAR